MGHNFHGFPILLCLVFGWMLHCRTVWCLERRGDFLACVNNSKVEELLETLDIDRRITDVDSCINFCIRSNFPLAVILQNLVGNDDHCGCLLDRPEETFPFGLCDSPCLGNPLDSCGGDELSSVYTTSNRSCDDPGIPVNGSPNDNNFIFGSEVKFNCSEGLVPDGPGGSRCWWVDNITLDIGWIPSPPVCYDPPLQITTKTTMEGDTTLSSSMTSPTIGPAPPNMGAIIGGLAAVIVVIIIVVIIIFVMCKKRRKSRADITPKYGASHLPLSDTKPKPKQAPMKTGGKEEANGVEEEDYLVPDAEVVATAKKNSGQGHTLQLVGERPRLPAPTSVKASLSPEESVYQNSLTIALSRSKENVNKDTKEKEVIPKPVKHNRGDMARNERTRATEGAVGKPPAVKTSSLPLDTDGIYQNTQMAVSKSTPRMPFAARISEGGRGSRDSSGTASQRSSYRDSFDYVNPNEVTEQEVYENAGVIGPRQGPRRPSDQPAKVKVVVDNRDSGGVYLDLI